MQKPRAKKIRLTEPRISETKDDFFTQNTAGKCTGSNRHLWIQSGFSIIQAEAEKQSSESRHLSG